MPARPDGRQDHRASIPRERTSDAALMHIDKQRQTSYTTFPHVSKSMELSVNGKNQDYRGAATLAGLLQSLGLAGARVVVELNGAIIGKPLHGATAIRDGDAIEIVRLVGGG